MKTIQLLQQLINNLYQNPAVLSALPWDEIGSCVLTEFELRKQLYPESQYEEITDGIKQDITNFETCGMFLSQTDAIAVLQKFCAMLTVLPSLSFSDLANERTTFLEAFYRHKQLHTTVVIGDSHVNFFSGNEALTYEPIGHDINVCPQVNDLPLTVFHLGPCLAYKSHDYGSTTGFREKLDFLISDFITPGASLLLCLGEIDIRMHVWKQAENQGCSYTEIVDDIISKYNKALLSLKEQGFDISVWSPIASQADDFEMDENFPRYGDEIERNMATLYFCEKLEDLCRDNGFGFYSITKDLIDAKTLRTKTEYICDDHCHLSQRAISLIDSCDQLFR